MEPLPVVADPAVLILNVGHRPTPLVRAALAEQGFRTWICESPRELRTVLGLRRWSLVLIDLPYPVGRGLARCAEVRDLYRGPLVVLSGHGTEEAQLRILEAGVDEFLDWPLSPLLLGARLRALLRRWGPPAATGEAAAAPLPAGDLVVDPARREVRRAGRRIDLTDLEFDLLHLLARHAGIPLSRETLYRELRGLPYDGRDRSMDLRVSRLRRKLGDDEARPRLILTVRGTGYQLAAAAL